MRGWGWVLLLLAATCAAQTALGQSAGESRGASETASKPAAASNAFPEDTSNVPVLGQEGPEQSREGQPTAAAPRPPRADADPARSPDDVSAEAPGGESGFSSSLRGLDEVSAPAEPEKKGKRGQREEKPLPVKTPKQVLAENLSVGKFYLDRKNWRAALSRFQSVFALDPESPEAFWGMAEAERGLGEYANARRHFELSLQLDPDGPHSRQAHKALEDPRIAGAVAEPAPK